MQPISYARHEFPAEIIQHAVQTAQSAFSSALSRARHPCEGASGSLNHIIGDNGQAIDLQDALDLDEEAVKQAEVTTGHTCDGGDRLGAGCDYTLSQLGVCGASRWHPEPLRSTTVSLGRRDETGCGDGERLGPERGGRYG